MARVTQCFKCFKSLWTKEDNIFHKPVILKQKGDYRGEHQNQEPIKVENVILCDVCKLELEVLIKDYLKI